MKVLNSNYEKELNENEIFDDCLNAIFSYLKTRISNFDLIKERSNNVIIQNTQNNEYIVKNTENNLIKLPFPKSASAFTTNMEVNYSNGLLNVVPGIALKKNYTKHQLIHEILHAISMNQNNHFSNGITYTKIGTSINYYNEKLEKMDNYNISMEAINEGITELLTSAILNEYNGNYPFYMVVSNLFMKKNNMLLNAYFSEDYQSLIDFYNDLEQSQDIINRNDLINLKVNDFDLNLFIKILKGAISYSNINEYELDKMLNYLDNYCILDSGSWKDLIDVLIK